MLARLWLHSQEMPERWALAHSARREERLEAAQRALRPTWDLRLVPVALSAWGAALLGTSQSESVGAALGAVLEVDLLLLVAAGLAMVLLVAVFARRSGRRLPGGAAPGSPRGRTLAALLPTAALCVVVVACVLLRAGTQQLAAAEDMRGMDADAQRVVVEVTDRPVTWQSATASSFGPGPVEVGEASSGVVVPVRLSSGARATVFAQDGRWASLRSGDRAEAVVSAPEIEQTDLQLRSTGPPQPMTEAQDRPSLLETATERFALAAQARGPDAAGLLPGMTYGDRSGLDTGLEKAMKVTGLTHLTAVSGSNCALVMALAGQLALGLGARRRVCVMIGLGALGLFVVLVGPDPSVLRAAVMGAVAALAVLSGRGPVSLAALSTAMCVLLVIDPGLGPDFGFALSVCATAGIVVTARPLTRVLEHLMPTVLAIVLAVPLVAQLWCGPVLALLTPTVATYAVPANVIAAPVVPLITVLGLAALILLGLGGPVGEALGSALLEPGSWAVGVIARSARFFAGLPGSTAPWLGPPAGPVLMLILSAGTVVALHRLDARWLERSRVGEVRSGPAPGPVSEAAWIRARRRERAWRSAGLIVIATGIAALVAVLRWPDQHAEQWSVLACDVGQGDAVLLRGRQDDRESTVLIDAGPDPGALRGCLKDAGVERLDLLVLTHDHADHVAGAEGLGQFVEIDRVWWSSASGRAPEELVGLDDRAARPTIGQRFEGAGLELLVLAPDPATTRISPESEDENNASIVLRAEVSDGSQRFSMLAAGDLEESGAGALLRTDPSVLDVDLLKVSHHGARNGGVAIIDAASPSLALASVGADNDYGHPHPVITEHLAQGSIPLARTDRMGAVAIHVQDGALVAQTTG